jgi:hypothetical protein
VRILLARTWRRFRGDPYAHDSLGMAAVSDEDVVRGSIHFLKRDALYDLEKPYTIRYALPDGTPRTNSQHEERHGLLIRNIRPQLQRFSLESHGFTVVKMESAMTYQDFESEDRIINTYLAEVARKLRETLKARHVQVYEHTVSTSAKHHIRQAF